VGAKIIPHNFGPCQRVFVVKTTNNKNKYIYF
jgi:hypothetical protein